MSAVDLIRSQNFAQMASLVTNPLFIKMVKAASENQNAESGKYDDLLKQLEKLSGLLASQKSDESSVNPFSASQANSANESEALFMANMLQHQSLAQIVDDLIAKADLMEDMLDLEVIPPDDLVLDFFAKLRKIISSLDQELRKNQKEQLDKKIKEEIKLAPSSDTESGFQEGLKLVVQ